MTLRITMMVAGIATFGSLTVARAQAPMYNPHPQAVPLPVTNPDVSDPASPTTPALPGNLPPLVTPEALPPPAPMPTATVIPVVIPAPNPYVVEGVQPGASFVRKVGTAVMLGGGYEDFTYAGPKNATNAGGSWDLRLAAGTRQFIGLEAAYVGGYRTVSTFAIGNDSALTNNGFEGNLRVNLPIASGSLLLEPFGFIGVGWQHYSLSKTLVTADVTSTDNVMTMPYGAGVMSAFGMFMLDARVTWRDTFYNDMFRATSSKLNTWGVGGNVGLEF